MYINMLYIICKYVTIIYVYVKIIALKATFVMCIKLHTFPFVGITHLIPRQYYWDLI